MIVKGIEDDRQFLLYVIPTMIGESEKERNQLQQVYHLHMRHKHTENGAICFAER